jgi:hypothetical protein
MVLAMLVEREKETVVEISRELGKTEGHQARGLPYSRRAGKMARPDGMVIMGGLRCRWPIKQQRFVSVHRQDAKLLSFLGGGSVPEESPRLLALRHGRRPIFADGRLSGGVACISHSTILTYR